MFFPNTPLGLEYGIGMFGSGENGHRICLVTPFAGFNFFLDQDGKLTATSLSYSLSRTWRYKNLKATLMPILSAGKDLTVDRKEGWFADICLQFMIGK